MRGASSPLALRRPLSLCLPARFSASLLSAYVIFFFCGSFSRASFIASHEVRADVSRVDGLDALADDEKSLESDLSRDFDRKKDAARATRDLDRAGLSLEPSVSSTIAAKAASSKESLRFFSLDRWNARSNENLRRGLMPRSMVAFGVSHAFSRVVSCAGSARRWRSHGSPVVVLAVMRRLRRPSARRRRRVELQTTSYRESPFVAGLGWQRCVVRVVRLLGASHWARFGAQR